MADRFSDTSAFAKHYRTELGTAKVDAFLPWAIWHARVSLPISLPAALLSTVSRLDAFVCADSNLCLIAAAEGLTVDYPEVPWPRSRKPGE